MYNGEQEGPNAALPSDPRIILGTTLVTLIVAGSAFVWRSNKLFQRHIPDSSQQPASVQENGVSRAMFEARSEKYELSDSSKSASESIHQKIVAQDSDTKDGKNSRPKERRRRGKDPLKEILKNGKKLKEFTKSGRLGGDSDDSGTTTPTLPQVMDSTRLQHSRDTSDATSSRSVSTSASSSRRMALPSLDPNPNIGTSQSSKSRRKNGHADPSSATPPISADDSFIKAEGGTNESDNFRSTDSRGPDSSVGVHTREPSHAQSSEVSTTIGSSSASHSSSTSTSSGSILTPSTSPTSSQPDNTPTSATYIHPSQSLPPLFGSSSSTFTSTRQSEKASSPWDWDTVTSPMTDATYRKPPRFNSKSRGSGSPSFSSGVLPTSTSAAAFVPGPNSYSSYAHSSPTSSPSLPPSTPVTSKDEPLPFTFPTLNASSDLGTSPSSSPRSIRIISTTGGGENGHGVNGVSNTGNSGPSRRAATPRTPAPSSGTNTPPPSLSAQTQIASLRGALEAARLREEKFKTDMEKYVKDMEMMRWESAMWRRREVELQTQVHHLMHQLQAYAALFASIPPQPLPSPQSGMNSPNPNVNSPQNGYQPSTPSSPGPHSPYFPMLSPAHMLAANGLHSQQSMLSHTHSSPQSPFFNFPPPHPHSQPLHQPYPLAQAQHSNQANIFSMLFPLGPNASASGSRPPSVTSSSVGSVSPDISGSPISSAMPFGRGRRRTRTRTQTAHGRIGTWSGEMSEGWLGVGEEEAEEAADDEDRKIGDDDDEDDDDGGGFSEALADAILKRPGSIRVLSRKGKGKEREDDKAEERPTEFTFPSLSNFGTTIKETKQNGVLSETAHSDTSPGDGSPEGKPQAMKEEPSDTRVPSDDSSSTLTEPHGVNV